MILSRNKIVNIVLLGFLMTFTGCFGDYEYAYNESVSGRYLSANEQFEEIYEQFSNGKLKTKWDLDSSAYFHEDSRAVQRFKENMLRQSLHLDDLDPSKAASEFHAKLKSYYTLVGADFTSCLEAYIDLDCECPGKRDSIKEETKKLYDKISQVETEMQKIQLEYLNKVGLQPKNEQ